MSRLKKLFNKQSSKQKSNRLIVFVNSNFWSRFYILTIVMLLLLAFLSIFGASFLNRLIDPLKYVNSNQAIVEIYPESNMQFNQSKKRIVLDFLQSNKNIAKVTVIPKKTLKSLLKKSVNVLNDISLLPFPTIINIEFAPNSLISTSDLQITLSQKVNGVYVESSGSLVDKLSGTIKISRNMILLIPIVLLVIIFLVIMFVILGLIYSHKKNIKVLHYLGASYFSIAKEFGIWIFNKTLKGCVIGLLLAMLLITCFLIYFNLNIPSMPSLTTFFMIIIVLLLIPLEAIIVSTLVLKKIIKWLN